MRERWGNIQGGRNNQYVREKGSTVYFRGKIKVRREKRRAGSSELTGE